MIGASAAGLSVVEGLRRLGFGGRLSLIGEETHLPYDRPPLSKQLLRGEWGLERLQLRGADALAGLDLDLRLGVRAVALDTRHRRIDLSDGDRLDYDAAVVATGLIPRQLPGAEGLSGVHTLRTLEDALALRESLGGGARLVVIGSGFIGAEAAAVARDAGASVTMVSQGPAPLAEVLGAELGALLAESHTAHGVRLLTGTQVTGLTQAYGRVTGVALTGGAVVTADAVLVAIGATPATDWLRGSGVPLGDGVLCDPTLHAGAGVWAAGDVACWPHPRTGLPTRIEHRTNATEQGLAVARNILAAPGEAAAFDPVPYAWSDQYDLRLQLYGRTRGADQVRIVEGSLAERKLVALYRSNGRVGGVVGINLPRPTRAYRALVAEGAEWSTAVHPDADPVDRRARVS
ncbi:NAD(P)/FAD-dependent oxidoreductase [Streptacidiphilus sp. P02-A3a]|uniref:NAD(P)/FAD-dependent oxidoreductase n=1 Tax=Streptacidiphilus sp. P02-A3a TaxID=2704468 RepID=UPI0021025EC2|nr:FAD/NAD(P)-binding oxidoreductase [Streptacidiphilus sp. P02-A3a]